jgi:NADPH:quinone reductase-like Zn-dependent oxidoreductase
MGVLSGLGDRVDTGAILHKNIRIQGTYVGSVAMFERLVAAVAQSGLRPVIDRVFAFEDARAAYAYLDSGAHLGKVVIRVAG